MTAAAQKYEFCSDEELVRRFQEGDGPAADYLMEKYKQAVRVQARALYLAGGDRDDLLQEGMFGLFKAIRTYKPGGEETNRASFRTYASVCISRQMYTAVRAAGRRKNAPLNCSVPLEELEEQQKESLLDAAASPEAIMIGRETARLLHERISEALSRYEEQVLELFLAGMDYRAIAKMLGKPDKSVDNALQRIRRKVTQIADENAQTD